MSLHKAFKLLGGIIIVGLLFVATSSFAFIVKNIEVRGLQRIQGATVRSYVPIQPGQNLRSSDSIKIIQALYKTGFFSDVYLQRRGGTLIVNVKERPTLFRVQVKGNSKIPKKQMDKVLKQLSIGSGQIYDSAKVASLVVGLREQYFNLGYYNAHITTVVKDVGRNRVTLTINVEEGKVAKVMAIRIIGNHFFSQRLLLKQLRITTPNALSFITHDDQYSSQKLDADIETLRSYYMNRGFINAQVLSQQVSISPDNSGLSISVAVSEGQRYRFAGVSFSGKLLGMQKQLNSAAQFQSGQWFSRQAVIDTSNAITAIYADKGYAFPQVIPQPRIDKINHTVTVNFNIDPRKRVYIRKIILSGNTETTGISLRNTMQVVNEGSLFSASNVNEAKRRLSTLPYITGVEAAPQPVPGQPDKVDLNYKFKEQSAGKASLSGGYSDVEGFLVSVSVADPNFLGTGNGVNVSFQKSQYSSQYSASYTNPFITTWGVSRSVSLSYSNYTPSAVNLASFDQSTLSTSLGYGIPLSLLTTLNASIGYDYTKLGLASKSPSQIKGFVHKYGDEYHEADLSLGLSRQNVDRYPFPTRGTVSSINGTLSAPLTDKSLFYYKLNAKYMWYQPLYKQFIFEADTTLGYGGGIGSTKELPFFEDYYAGGISTLAGFEANSLGPLDSNGDPLGGNVLTLARLNLIFPNGISDRVRTAIGVNAGNVYENEFDPSELRASVGLFVTWLSPFAPIQIGIAYPIVRKSADRVAVFGFNLTTSL